MRAATPAAATGEALTRTPPPVPLARRDDEEDGLSPASGGVRPRITLSGEARLGRGTADARSERLLPEAPPPPGGVSYTQRMRERYTGEPPQRTSPARPRRLTPEALLQATAPAPARAKAAPCSLM